MPTPKRIILILSVIIGILLVPLIAMQFTHEVQWSAFDFFTAFFLLASAAFAFEWIGRKVINKRKRFIFWILMLLVMLLIWLEIAVGIFGTPFAGN